MSGPGGGIPAPPGWSHLVIKSHPHIADADRRAVSGLVARLASFLFTVTLADVRPEPGTQPPRYRLRDAAIGMGTRVNGQDVVLSPDTARGLGADLGWIERTPGRDGPGRGRPRSTAGWP